MLHKANPLNEEEVRLIESKALRSILIESIRLREQVPSSVSSYPAAPESKHAAQTEEFPADFSCQSCLFFDIETTGLSADTAFPFLIGCICCEDGIWSRHQFCIRLIQEERHLLSSFFEMAKKARFLIHFNGNTFDIPFIQKRAAANGLCSPLETLISIDLYQRFRPLRNLLHLPHMKQNSLEKYVGWEREDRLSGKEVVAQFWSYAASQNSASENSLSPACNVDGVSAKQTAELLLRHNRDDLLGMLQILKLEAYHVLFSGKNCVFKKASCDQEALRLSFSPILPFPHPLTLTKPVFGDEDSPGISLTVNSLSGYLSVPIFHGTLRYYLPDYKNYYYLPLEHQAIHKSIASYVAKEYRIPAKPDTCFVEKSGCFLPLPKNFPAANVPDFLKEKPLFRENYESRHLYFEYSEGLAQQETLTVSYAKTLLTYIGSAHEKKRKSS
ncbi:MAG: ribonuclease H-like domain-containing protein [Lachnospiraceae bacterium]|nr:ribonuclease H-like domain-containing protein [Lachnospiraceae bacterium]